MHTVIFRHLGVDPFGVRFKRRGILLTYYYYWYNPASNFKVLRKRVVNLASHLIVSDQDVRSRAKTRLWYNAVENRYFLY